MSATRNHTTPATRHGRIPGALAALLALVLAVTGCTRGDAPSDATKPPRSLPSADTTLQTLATGLASLDVTGVALDRDPAGPQADLVELTAGMAELRPRVTVKGVTYSGEEAMGELAWEWPLFPSPWAYTTTVPLLLDGRAWEVAWQPSIVERTLTDRSRLELTRLVPDRGRILGNGGTPLVEEADVLRIGLDKTKLDAAQTEASARALAALVGIDAEQYVATVAAYGPQAFVPALIERGSTPPAGLADIPGAMAQKDRLMLSPYRGFGGPLIGALGEPTPDIVTASAGAVQRGDTVGRSGLQAWHDEALRGVTGVQVDLVERDAAPAPRPGEPVTVLPAMVHKQEAVPGKDLATTVDRDLQTKLEGVLANEPVKTAMAVVQPSTGKVLALAQSAGGAEEPMANWGHYPPGSTFKVASALALVRAGMTAETPVPCPTSATVDGRVIQNYPEYPAAHNGTITLKDAIAYSCNTTFVATADAMGDDGLARAAGSLGVGTDYDARFLSYYGEVPAPANVVGKAEQTFGQGTVEMSPMAVAGMAASVAAGRTVVPWLVEPGPLTPTTEPLTEPEAAELRVMLQQVVETGSATMLQGTLIGAKSGTAEFGQPDGTLGTHVWMMGYTANDLAIAAFAETGRYGSDLAPVVKAALG